MPGNTLSFLICFGGGQKRPRFSGGQARGPGEAAVAWRGLATSQQLSVRRQGQRPRSVFLLPACGCLLTTPPLCKHILEMSLSPW